MPTCGAAACSSLVLDFGRVTFMEPWATAMFGANALEMRRRGIGVEGRHDVANPAHVYLQGMGLFDLIRTGSTPAAATGPWQDSGQNTGLHLIRVDGDLRQSYECLRRFKDSAGRLALQHCPNAADVLANAMDEIGRNVIQHAASPIGVWPSRSIFPTLRGSRSQSATSARASSSTSGPATRN